MSTIEDKILDGPTVHYCDSGNDDIRTGEDAGFDLEDPEASTKHNESSSLFIRPDEEIDKLELNRFGQKGYSTNTGPKGVIEDHRKQSQSKFDPKINDSDIEAEFKELLKDDSIIKSMAQKRMALLNDLPSFGFVSRLESGTQLLDEIDKENPQVLVIVHIYVKYSKFCAKVDKCLDPLATEYKHIKFLTLEASAAGLSDNFKQNGVPALLAYRGGNFLKSLVQLKDHLDKDFEVAQLKDLMLDTGLITLNLV